MDVLHKDPLLEVYRLRLGPYDNNAYVIIDPEARRAVIIDAPPEGEAILDVVRPHAVDHILITHEHPDHIMTLGLLRDATGAKVRVHEDETNVPGELIDARLRHSDVLQVGRHEIRVLHTPGHTPGSVSFVLGDYLFSGDTLFPGGPGASRSPEALQQEIRSITDRLYALPDGTQVYPGHGDDTTIERSKEEYAMFAARPHPADLHGTVTWADS